MNQGEVATILREGNLMIMESKYQSLMNQGEVATCDKAGAVRPLTVSIPYESGRSGHTLLEMMKWSEGKYQSLMNQGEVATPFRHSTHRRYL